MSDQSGEKPHFSERAEGREYSLSSAHTGSESWAPHQIEDLRAKIAAMAELAPCQTGEIREISDRFGRDFLQSRVAPFAVPLNWFLAVSPEVYSVH